MAERLKEKCGIFGIYGEHDAAYLTSQGLSALQHRGQEGSGIATTDGTKISLHKGEGLVAQVFRGFNWSKLSGHAAVGHNRYGTSSKAPSHEHLQPVNGKYNVLVHNGNLPDTRQLKASLQQKGKFNKRHNDSELMQDEIDYYSEKGASLEEAILEAHPLFTGAYSFLAMDREKIVALRDPYGIRPLSIGRLEEGHIIFSSETCALDKIRAEFVRDVNPGEMVTVDQNGLHSLQLSQGQQKLDAFEFVYFARPDSLLNGKSVHTVRKRMGERLALEEKKSLDADLVMSVPDSGTPAAIGYAQTNRIPYDMGFINDRYEGKRTFIAPKGRAEGVAQKLNLIKDTVKNKRLIVVDDSIVRGTTSKEFVRRLKEDGGAREVHLRISSPEVKYPDFYGINTPRQKDLIASQKSVEEIRDYLGADSLQFLSFDGMIAAIGIPAENLNTSCFNGEYPIDIGRRREEIIF